MEDIYNFQLNVNDLLYERIEGTKLKPGHRYIRKQFGRAEFVGEFQRSYTMGSGDGTTIYYEFIWNGIMYTIHDDMFGTISGDELMQFYEVP